MTSTTGQPHPTFDTSRCRPPSPPGFSTVDGCKPRVCQHQGRPPRGLWTPPTDSTMGTTYEVPPHLQLSENYPLHHASACGPVNGPSDRRRQALNERPLPNEQLYNPPLPSQPQAQYPACPPTEYRPTSPELPAPSTTARSTGSDYAPRYDSARQSKLSTPARGVSPAGSTASASMTHHSMTVPERISPKGGNLADFVAETSALFWFESTKLLESIEMGVHIPNAAPTATASQHFRKWVSSILTTTQVTQNVVILALLYIYRLKKANPTVKGRPGSEYRLLTVALMLGNKFLDDNTYTNKTWADVSGISVNEIHVMEVEFLSNMRYSLLVSAQEWEQWLDRLRKFSLFLELAQIPRSPVPSPIPIRTSPAPLRAGASPLPSPTVPLIPGLQSATHSFNLHSPNLAPVTTGQTWPAYPGSEAVSPLAGKHDVAASSRKRTYPDDDDVSERPLNKRVNVSSIPATLPSQAPVQYAPVSAPVPTRPQTQQQPAHYGLGQLSSVAPPQPRQVPTSQQGRPQLPSLNTSQTTAPVVPATQVPTYAAPTYAPAQPTLSLPPLSSGVRAMATVYTTTYAPSQSIPAPCNATTPTTSFPPVSYGTPTKRLSPQTSLSAYPGSSPLVMGNAMPNGAASGLHTPISHSPSIYLQHRNSPYKPIRHVNTLLYPPPAAFQQYNLPNPVLPNQMHYQPLGKRNEYRTGIVPEFLNSVPRPAPYPQQHQAGPSLLPSSVPQATPQQPRAPYQLPSAARTVASYPEQY
ncbi:hypothetical protein VTJ83DRAFT_1424 [Remersonia thermophila]|uniref:Uncharacterized protein n=1 Tax=Remersonia thermophila TaxID=72144 RepID=A0ABR4DNZ4_9PEZI